MIQLPQVANVCLAHILHFFHCNNLVVQFPAENSSLRARTEPLDVFLGKTQTFSFAHAQKINKKMFHLK